MKVTEITISELETCLNQMIKFKNTFFWTPPSSARQRRYEEKHNSNQWKFKVDNKPVEVNLTIRCSCKNYYATKELLVDGGKERNYIVFLQKCLNSLKEQNNETSR